MPTSTGMRSWLRGLIGMMHAETDRPRPGGAAIVADLSTALFTVLLRALIERGGVSRGLIALMADARMARVVEAVVRAPEQPWTVDSLAALCNVSRATLARRFAQLGGMTPLELVTTLRMERAARLLRQDGLSAAAVGEQCGVRLAGRVRPRVCPAFRHRAGRVPAPASRAPCS